jgi:hypothetical protein
MSKIRFWHWGHCRRYIWLVISCVNIRMVSSLTIYDCCSTFLTHWSWKFMRLFLKLSFINSTMLHFVLPVPLFPFALTFFFFSLVLSLSLFVTLNFSFPFLLKFLQSFLLLFIFFSFSSLKNFGASVCL